MTKKLVLQMSMALLTALAVQSHAEVERVETQDSPRPHGGAQEYIDKVAERRAAYGNKDGLRHSTLLNGNRFGFSLGYMNFTNGSSANGPHFGLNYVSTFNDNVGVEFSGGYGLGSQDTTVANVKSATSVGRTDVSIGVRGQTAISLGDAHKALVPFITVGPVYSHINSKVESAGFSVSSSDSSIGFSVAPGIEMIMGGMSIGLKANYLITQSVATGGGDTSAFVPQFTVGWAF